MLTFIARDQRPAFGLEVGRDDITEAVGQDVVCFVEDVLPAVGTGLEDREGFRAGKDSPEPGGPSDRSRKHRCLPASVLHPFGLPASGTPDQATLCPKAKRIHSRGPDTHVRPQGLLPYDMKLHKTISLFLVPQATLILPTWYRFVPLAHFSID